MLLSKNVKEGSLVSLRGNKYILASNKSKLRGAYTKGDYRKSLTLDGEIVESKRPEGIVVYGQAVINSTNIGGLDCYVNC
jgi:hypothetical protein